MRYVFVLAAMAATTGVPSHAQSDVGRFKLESLEQAAKPVAVANPRQIEESIGGRLGIALVDAEGKLLLGFNREERFAMCSTFKAPLAAAVLMGAEQGRYGMDGTLPVAQSDLLDYGIGCRHFRVSFE